MSRVTVLGLDGRALDPEARRAVEGAALVVGGRRHLRSLGVGPDRAAELRGDLRAVLEGIEGAGGPVVVLASGDPGFFGVLRLLRERFEPEELRVVPAVSSVALASARAGLRWDDAAVVSAHGRGPRRAVNACRAHPKVAVLTSPGFGPAELARELAGWDRTLFVAERLGEPDERLFRGGLEEVAGMGWRDPNVVLVLDERRAEGGAGWVSAGMEGPRRWGLPEEEFEHRGGMISKQETRALVLGRLGPGVGDLVWDVGAGSGSVAIECARHGAAAVAIERDPGSVEHIRLNADRHGVDVRIVEGEAPAALDDLPEPDAVFVGGTGGEFEATLKLCALRARRAVVLTLVGLERVIPAGEVLAGCGLEVRTTFMQSSRLGSVGPAHRIVPESAVFVVTGERVEP